MRWLLLLQSLHVVAAAISLMIARRHRDYRPVAAFLAATALADVALAGLIVAGAPPSLPDARLAGLARFIGHARQGLYLVWPLGLAALVVTVFSGRFPRVVPVAYGVTLAVLVLGDEILGAVLVRRLYLGTELSAIVVAIAAVLRWPSLREPLTVPHVMTLLLLFGEIGLLLGPWHHDIFAGWDAGRMMYSTAYALLIVLQAGILWRSPAAGAADGG